MSSDDIYTAQEMIKAILAILQRGEPKATINERRLLMVALASLKGKSNGGEQ